jgi:hypothetical protein
VVRICGSKSIHQYITDPEPWLFEEKKCRIGTYAEAASLDESFVGPPIVVGIKELLEPLEELKVVLEPSLHQPVHWDYLG